MKSSAVWPVDKREASLTGEPEKTKHLVQASDWSRFEFGMNLLSGFSNFVLRNEKNVSEKTCLYVLLVK